MVDRRGFLRSGGGALLAAGLLAACHGSTSRPTPRPTPSGSTAGGPPATSGLDWHELARALDGDLVLPSDRRYATARRLFDPRFDRVRPAAVAMCRTVADVQRSIAFARRHSVRLAARGGGHSYAGYSTCPGLVVDVTGLDRVRVDRDGGTARVGAGARLVDVYAQLAAVGVAVPAGSCPTVGIAGLTLGGGYGVVSRKYGLTCDVLAAAQVVTADGRVLDCDGQRHADLLWACRGGGGGNFGIVTAFTFRTHPVGPVSLFTLRWPWPAAAQALGAWQSWGPAAPDELFSNCQLLAAESQAPGTEPTVKVSGVHLGGPQRLQALLEPLLAAVPARPARRFVGLASSYLHAMLVEAGCESLTVAQCHLPTQHPEGVLRRQPFLAASDFLTAPLSPAGAAAVVDAVERRQADPRLTGGGVAFDAYGGAINRVPPAATAFVHRGTLCSVQYTASWAEGEPAAVVDANAAWLRGLHAAMRQHVSGFAYQNYIDPALADWKRAYYGDNYPRLVRVKAAYDPDDVFHFAQGIPPR